ncbi:MAG: nuclear transport factor 2 family protein [Desulfuromonadales bacterium]|nr:nuclear transport factor 2 family protein [Desulfuromonadales bacterium]
MAASKTDLLKKFFQLSTQGKWEEAELLLHPDFELLPAASHPYAGEYRGVKGFKGLFRKVFMETYERFEPKILEFTEGPNSVVTICSVTVTGKKTGRTVNMSLAEVFTFEDDRLRSITPHYLDTKVLVEL